MTLFAPNLGKPVFANPFLPQAPLMAPQALGAMQMPDAGVGILPPQAQANPALPPEAMQGNTGIVPPGMGGQLPPGLASILSALQMEQIMRAQNAPPPAPMPAGYGMKPMPAPGGMTGQPTGIGMAPPGFAGDPGVAAKQSQIGMMPTAPGQAKNQNIGSNPVY